MVDDTSAADEYALRTVTPPTAGRRTVARRTAALIASGALVLGLIGGGAIVALTPLGDSSPSQQAGPGAGGPPDAQQLGQLPDEAPTGRPQDQEDDATDDASSAT